MMPSNAAIAAEIAIAERMAGSADASVARYAEGALDGMRWAVGALAAPPSSMLPEQTEDAEGGGEIDADDLPFE